MLGRDCSGIVVAVGKNVSKVEQGNEVWHAQEAEDRFDSFLNDSFDFIIPVKLFRSCSHSHGINFIFGYSF